MRLEACFCAVLRRHSFPFFSARSIMLVAFVYCPRSSLPMESFAFYYYNVRFDVIEYNLHVRLKVGSEGFSETLTDRRDA